MIINNLDLELRMDKYREIYLQCNNHITLQISF